VWKDLLECLLALFAWVAYLAEVAAYLPTLLAGIIGGAITYPLREALYEYVELPLYNAWLAVHAYLAMTGYVMPLPGEINMGLTTLGMSVAEGWMATNSFLPMKNNLAEDTGGLAFWVRGHDLGNGIWTSCVEWDSEPVTMTADEAMAPQGDPEERSALNDAKDFLRDQLVNGPVASKEVKANAKQVGYGMRTVDRAKSYLRIKAVKEGFGKTGVWVWRLPDLSVPSLSAPNPDTRFGALNEKPYVARFLGGLDDLSTPSKCAGVLSGDTAFNFDDAEAF